LFALLGTYYGGNAGAISSRAAGISGS
jgi:hypothetical protein